MANPTYSRSEQRRRAIQQGEGVRAGQVIGSTRKVRHVLMQRFRFKHPKGYVCLVDARVPAGASFFTPDPLIWELTVLVRQAVDRKTGIARIAYYSKDV